MSSLVSNALVIAWIVVVPATVLAALLDLKCLHIPNRLTIPLGLIGVIYYTAIFGWSGLAFSSSGLVVGFLLLIVFFLIGAMGAGDIKLLAAVGAWLGATNAIRICLIACLAAGVYSLGVCLARGRLGGVMGERMAGVSFSHSSARLFGTTGSVESVVQREDRRLRVLPFALMIAVGVIVSVMQEYGLSFKL